MAAGWYYLRISFSNISLFLFYLLHHIRLLLHVIYAILQCQVSIDSIDMWMEISVCYKSSIDVYSKLIAFVLFFVFHCSVTFPSSEQKVVLVMCEWYLGVVLSCMIISAWLQALTSAYALITFVFFSVTQCKLTVFASNSVLCISLHMHSLYFRSLEVFLLAIDDVFVR